MDHPVKFIGTVQIGITVFGIALGAIGQPLLTDYFDGPVSYGIAYVLAFVILTYLSVALGELVPKALALQRAEPIAKTLAIPLEILQNDRQAVHVAAAGLGRRRDAPLRRPARPAGELAHTEEDIRHIVAGAEDAGVIATTEEEMLYKVFDFADKEVHEVMVPRPQVVAISIEMPTEEALAALLESPFTRYPVYRDSLDEIAGILHVRDLFSALHDRGIANVDLEELLRPVYIVPETKDLAALLAEFRKQNQHMAVVVDEYGAMEGIVTLEDLLEEIVGEIEDEFDLPDESVERIDETHIRIDGTFPIDDFNEQFANGARGRGLPHHGRDGLRRPRACARGGRRGSDRRAGAAGARDRGLPDPAARGRVPRAGARGRAGRGVARPPRRRRTRPDRSAAPAPR